MTSIFNNVLLRQNILTSALEYARLPVGALARWVPSKVILDASDNVQTMIDVSGNGYTATQAVLANRAGLAQSPLRFNFDVIDDSYTATLPNVTGSMLVATTNGTWVMEVNISAGAYTIGPYRMWDNTTDIAVFSSVLSASDISTSLTALQGFGGTVTEEAVALDVEAVANFVARTAIKILRDEFGEDNIGIVVNEPLPDATLPIFHSVGIHWWKNRSVPKCPLCDGESI